MKSKKPSYAQHFVNLGQCSLSANGSEKFEKEYFYWEFDLKPSLFSKTYRVLLIWDYKLTAPKVYILNNELHDVSKEKIIPHLYSREKVQLCLYYPKYKEFNVYMSLCETIIPWTYLWLSYYEEWQYSGEWKGGGVHPEVNSSTEAEESITPLKKFRSFKQLKKKKIKKSLTDKIYGRRKKHFDKISE